MAQDFGTGKTLVVLAIVLGCFAILWPKIFYPMMQTAFAMSSPKTDSDGRLLRDNERPPHLHPSSAGSVSTAAGNVRRGPIAEDVADKFLMREGRPFPQPQARNPVKPTPKSGGAMSIIMPIYTVGIVVFFLYTVLKLVFKKPNEAESKKPLIKDFHMDSEYHKFVLQTPIAEPTTAGIIRKEKVSKKKPHRPRIRTPKFEEKIEEEMDSKDYEIFKLKKKLEDTEHAMERIMNHMGSVSACLSDKMKLEKKLADTQDSGVRQRHKKAGRKTPDSSQTSKKCYIEEVPDDNSVSTLEEDLSELISMCKATDDSLKNKDGDDSSDEKMDNSAEKEEESFESEEISSNDDEDVTEASALQSKRYQRENARGQKGVCS